MIVEYIQIKSDQKAMCEDYVVVDPPGIFAVLDGATPTSPFQDEKGRNGAVLASKTAGDALKEAASGHMTIQEMIGKANETLLTAMVQSGVHLENRHDTWNTCLAMVRLQGDYIEYGQIGDCMIVAVTASGDIHLLSVDMIDGIAERARGVREKMRQSGFPIQSEDYYRVKQHSIIFNRYLANKEPGYAVLNGDPCAVQFVHAGRVLRKDYRQLLLLTDGLFPENKDWKALISGIQQKGLKQYVMDAIAEEAANQREQDDKTAIWIDLLPGGEKA